MKFKTNLNWHVCKNEKFKILFDYKHRPKNEKKYEISGRYRRFFYKCDVCDHIIAKHDFKIKEIYKKTYLDLTYKNIEGISKKFQKVINLPINKSDNKNRVRRIDKFLNDKKKYLLDIGSGTGVFLYEMIKKGFKIKGIDLDKRYANFLKQKNIKIYSKDITKLKIKKKFDFLTFNKVLEHVSDPVKMLQNSKRLLKKQGSIYIEVPDSSAKKKENLLVNFV